MVFLGLRSILLKSVPKGAAAGLYGGKGIMHGVKVTPYHKKTKRIWKPNVQPKQFYSELLDQTYAVDVTPFVLRWIDKAGGFDPYIYHTSDKKLDSKFGSALKEKMKRVLAANPSLAPPPRVVRTHAPPKRWTDGPPPLRKRQRPIFILPAELLSSQQQQQQQQQPEQQQQSSEST